MVLTFSFERNILLAPYFLLVEGAGLALGCIKFLAKHEKVAEGSSLFGWGLRFI
jgi:hypothetical protein